MKLKTICEHENIWHTGQILRLFFWCTFDVFCPKHMRCVYQTGTRAVTCAQGVSFSLMHMHLMEDHANNRRRHVNRARLCVLLDLLKSLNLQLLVLQGNFSASENQGIHSSMGFTRTTSTKHQLSHLWFGLICLFISFSFPMKPFLVFFCIEITAS